MTIQRIPSAFELSPDQFTLLRKIVANSFMPGRQVNQQDKARLLMLALIHDGMGGLIATPAGRIAARFSPR